MGDLEESSLLSQLVVALMRVHAPDNPGESTQHNARVTLPDGRVIETNLAITLRGTVSPTP